MQKEIVLTGITTTGTPHLGNYVGAIRPAVAASRRDDVQSVYFLADLHALVKAQQPDAVHRSSLEVAATWLALGLDADRALFYRQSDVPEIAELNWILMSVTAKGLMNRAHAYKAAVQANEEAGSPDPDRGITMALFCYPVLMAADILLYDADVVPVGKDQKQHLEITQELARKLNHSYGPVLRVPRAQIDEKVMTIPGLDGRKMSKSYGNTIELWGTDKELKKKVSSIKTDSTEYGQPLDPDTDTLFALFALFAAPDRVGAVRAQYRAGRKDPSVADASLADPATNYFGWGDAKKALLEQLLDTLGPARQEYARLIADKPHLRKLLLQGAERARTTAQATLARVRQVCGIVR